MSNKNKVMILVLAMGLCAVAGATPTQWLAGAGGNDHWYEFITVDPVPGSFDAEAAAEGSAFMGEPGYLVTITSQAEQDFLNSLWVGLQNQGEYLIGASDRVSEGTFAWIGGPEDGQLLSYTNWSPGEPSQTGNEDYVIGWRNSDAAGGWNDVVGTFYSYVVEFDMPQASGSVPVAAPLVLMLAGLAAAGVTRRRGSR